MFETGRFYIKIFMPICTRENFCHPAKVFFFNKALLSLLVDTIDTSGCSLFIVFFFPTSKQN